MSKMFIRNTLCFLCITEVLRVVVYCVDYEDYDEDEAKKNVLKCRELEIMKIKKAVSARILHLHNDFRNRVAGGFEMRGSPGPQPRAKNIMKLEWHPHLQKLAQDFVNHCDVDEMSYTENSDGLGTIGANIHTEQSEDGVNIKEILYAWFNEVENFDAGQHESYSIRTAEGDRVDHYAQVVWGPTTLLGCAHASFLNRGNRVHRFACLYSEKGNIEDQPIYHSGIPCTVCVCDVTYTYLCKNKRYPNETDCDGGVDDDDCTGYTDNGDITEGNIVEDDNTKVVGTETDGPTKVNKVLKGVRFFSEFEDYDPCDCQFTL